VGTASRCFRSREITGVTFITDSTLCFVLIATFGGPPWANLQRSS
jgi:hypothetical protein